MIIAGMTTNQPTSLTNAHVHTLWEKLTQELIGILDAHGVCAAVASEVALFTRTTTVVAMSNRLKQFHDVWICQPDGKIEQTRWEDAGITLERLNQTNNVVAWDKFGISAREQIQSELWHLSKESVLAVPLPFAGSASHITPSGALFLLDPPPDCPLHQSNLDRLGMHITTFLDRAYLRHRSDQQEIEFTVVSEISHALTAKLNLENIYQQVTNSVRRTLNVHSMSIGLADPVTREIVFVSALMGPLFHDLPPIRLQAGQGIAGYVALHGEPIIVNNAYADKRFYSRPDTLSGFETQSILCVPLMVENRVIGVLEAINKKDGDFNNQDLKLLQAISGPLAAAIENARLHLDVLAEKRRIETMFASMSEGILVVNHDGRITIVNDALCSLLRLEEEALTGQEAHKAVRARAGNFAEFIEYALRAKEDTPQIACDVLQGNGEYVPVLVSGAAITNEQGEVQEGIFVFSDLRQIRELERMRDDFFHNIIHELRTPLATILMYARLLREGKAADNKEKADRFLGVIERESDRLQRMVRQMLQLAKLEAREIQRSSEFINLNKLLDELLPPLADRATEKGLLFSQRIQPNLPFMLGNEETLYIVFKNLVENAIKFTLSGAVRVNAQATPQEITVRVSDDGIGIPVEAMPNLYKRFYRTSTAVERGIAGTGLGLYMVKEGVEKHSGTITVDSKEGKGTTFILKFPAAAQ